MLGVVGLSVADTRQELDAEKESHLQQQNLKRTNGDMAGCCHVVQNTNEKLVCKAHVWSPHDAQHRTARNGGGGVLDTAGAELRIEVFGTDVLEVSNGGVPGQR
jgi:hypothetical protein